MLPQTSDPPPASVKEPVDSSPVAPRHTGNERGIWVVAGRIGGAVLALLTHALLTRLLTQAEYGKYLFILSAVTLLIGVAIFGLDRALVRYIAEGFALGDKARVKRALSLGLITLFISSFACTVLVPPALMFIGYYFDSFPSDAVSITVIIGAVTLAAGLQFIAEVFRGMHDQKKAAMFDAQASKPLANGLTLAAVAIVGYFLPLNAAGAMGLQVAVLALLCLLGANELRKGLAQIDQLEPVKGQGLPPLTASLFFITCVPLVLSQVIGIANMQAELWILGATLTDSDVAMFGASRRFVMAVSMPLMALNLIVLPSIPKLYVQNRLPDLEKLLQQNATLATLPSLFAVALVLLFPAQLLAFMYGPEYSGAALCLMALALGQAIHMITGNAGQVLMLTGRERLVLVVEVMAAILLFGLGPFVTIGYGLTGLAVLSAIIVATKKIAMLLLARWLIGVWTHASISYLPAVWLEAKQLLSGRGNRRRGSKTEPAVALNDETSTVGMESLP